MTGFPASIEPDALLLRLYQQEQVARFGLFALSAGPIERLLDEACRVACDGLGTNLAKVLRYRPNTDDLLVEAGRGWHAGVVGVRTLGGGLDSPAGYALHTGKPTVCNHLGQEERFRTPSLLAEHGVQSAINVVIGPIQETTYGVLEVDSTRRNDFVQEDTSFLQALANVLSAGLLRAAAEQAKDALIRDKDLLLKEVHHRVKNSLQLVKTIMTLQSRGSSDETREQLETAANRIMSIAAVHRRLYEGGSVIEGDAQVYIRGLLDDMRPMFDGGTVAREVILELEPMMLPADRLTSLGLVFSELVVNAVKHGVGKISVQIRRIATGLEIVVADEGTGFPVTPGRSGLGVRLIQALARGVPGKAFHIDRTVDHSRVVVNLTF